MAKHQKPMKVKRIIDGHLYDTMQSTLIAESRYAGASEEENYKEGLFSNENGVLFLAAEGGVESFYSAMLQNGKPERGSDIIPLTTSEARRWLEDHDHIDEINRLFGDQAQAGHGTVQVDLWTTPELKERAEAAALDKNVSVNDWLNMLISKELN